MNIFNKKELSLTIQTLSNTLDFELEEVKNLIEDVFSVSARQKFSKESVLVAKIKKDYSVDLFREYKVIGDNWEGLDAEKETYTSEYFLYKDQLEEMIGENSFNFGSKVLIKIENFEADRHVINVAKQQLKVKLAELRKQKIKDEFSDNSDELISVIVKGFDKNGYAVELSNGHVGKLLKSKLFNPNEKLKVGTRQVVMFDKDSVNNHLSFKRCGDDFVKLVFEKEIEDVRNELINIKGVCQIPNLKTVVAVYSSDKKTDPVGSCIGSRGVRINAVSLNLSNENVEIVKWSNDASELIMNILGEGVVQIIVEDNKTTVVAKDDVIDKIKGRNEYKKTVLSKFLNTEVFIVGESEFEDDNVSSVTYFEEELNLDKDSATLISNAGFFSVDELCSIKSSELARILEIDNNSAEMLISASKDSVFMRNKSLEKIKTDLFLITELDNFLISKLIKAGIKDRNDLAELDSFELKEILPVDMSFAGELILLAREVWEN